jgi:two-component system CheB/CheR fusion protein
MRREKSKRKRKAGIQAKSDGRGSAKGKFPIVGVGASAGGLESFERLLKALPKDTGMALVLVQHLDPTHASQLTEILCHATTMPVAEARQGMELLPNHVYIIPPNKNIFVKGRVLQLEPRSKQEVRHLPVDLFFRSLAAEHKNRAIGIILSGTATDGAEGMRAIKDEGGITFAQEPHTAKYHGMPQSAINAGGVDFVLTPEEIAAHLARIGSHSYMALPETEEETGKAALAAASEVAVAELFRLLKKSYGVDFHAYKFSTLDRRIKRRMAFKAVESLPDYVKHVRQEPEELRTLFHDMLIGVTEFFRQPGTFEQLKRAVFPALLENRNADAPIRIWVVGCSTGEEVYSIAIALLEFLGNRASATPIQIFGTDVNEDAIKRARTGRYAKGIAGNVGPARLRRFFTKVEDGYEVRKAVRDLCVFAKHDVLRDAPFSRLDLVSCRNLLIYLKPAAHLKLIPLFHYTLKPSGFLVLGSAETIGGLSNLFSLENRKYKIYARKSVAVRPSLEFSPERLPEIAAAEGHAQPPIPRGDFDQLKDAADQLILNHYGPPAVLVGENMEIIHFRGHTGAFLEPAPGVASLNLLKMAREGLLRGLQSALQSARKTDSAVHRLGLRVDYDGRERVVNLHVVPLRAVRPRERTFLVVFEDVTPREAEAEKPSAAGRAAGRSGDGGRSAQLKQELAATKSYLQSVIEGQEAANEELRSLNEEIQSTNEELQSTGEELETANEELQSANEELNTLNDELLHRNQELGVVNNDLLNLLNGLNLTVVMLDCKLHIRRFTPAAQQALNLIPGDIGRPLSDIRLLSDFPHLETSILDAMETARPHGEDVQDRQGHWFSLQVLPYITTEGKIDGAIVILYDIDVAKRREAEVGEANVRLGEELARRKQAEETARGVERQFRVVADSLNDMIPYVSADLRVLFSNRAHEKWWGVPHGGLDGRSLHELLGPRVYEQLRPYVEEALHGRQTSFEGYVDYENGPGRRYVRTDYIPDRTETGKVVGLYIVKKDMTALKQAEEKFQAIVESAPDAMVLTDENGEIVLMNGQAERLFGHKRDDLIGKFVEALLPQSFRKKHVSHRASYLLEPESRPMGEGMELFGLRSDGSQFPVEVSLSPLRSNGSVLTCAIIRDVSQQRALARERKDAAVAGERQRMARDVHDTLAQGLTGIVVQLQAAEAAFTGSPEDALGHCVRARELAQANLIEARQSVLSLSEGQVETVGLAEALQELVDRLRTETQIRLDLSIEGTPRRLDAAIEENLLGIARQAIDNAIQHSGANEIRAELAFEKTRVRLQVADDGCGFTSSAVSRGFGLKSMEDRAKQCGGKLDLQSEPGKGTCIAVSVRLRRSPGSPRFA